MLKLVSDFDYSTLVVVMLYVMWFWRFISLGNKYDGMFYDFICCCIRSFRFVCDLDNHLGIIPSA